MKTLTDKAIQFRTFPVVPRKRVKFNENSPVINSSFGSSDEVFRCTGGYFTHQSYNLLDYFVSYWFEILNNRWKQKFGSEYPKAWSEQALNRLHELTPILKMGSISAASLEDNLIDLFQHMRDYAIIPEISDIDMRKHPSLRRLSSKNLNAIIEKTSKAKLKTIYSVRVLKDKGNRKFLGWKNISNLDNQNQWSGLFEYKVLDERRAKDGRVIESFYKFGFNQLFGIAMIHNTICSGTWSVNPKLYVVSGDAQLLYRYLIIAGGGLKPRPHLVDYLGHRIGWREKQKSRLAEAIGRLFEELKDAELIRSYDSQKNSHGKIYFTFEVLKSPAKRKS